MRSRCRAPGCGRFIEKGKETCEGHVLPDTPSPPLDMDPLSPEVAALRHALNRVLVEIEDAERQATLISRVVSVGIQATKVRHQIGGQPAANILAALQPVLEALDREMNQHDSP